MEAPFDLMLCMGPIPVYTCPAGTAWQAVLINLFSVFDDSKPKSRSRPMHDGNLHTVFSLTSNENPPIV